MVEPDRHIDHLGDNVDQLRVTHRSRTHHHASNAGIGQALRIVNAANTTASLHTSSATTSDSFDHRTIVALTGGRIEVDDVNPLSTFVDERLRNRESIVGVVSFSRKVALLEPHHFAAAHINGRKQQHDYAATRRAASTKLPSSAKPSTADFSG